MTGTQLLPELVGRDVAKELTYTARIVSGEEAVRLGLATRTDPDPLAAALARAKEIAGRSPHAIRAAKRLLNLAGRTGLAPGFATEQEEIRALIGTPNRPLYGNRRDRADQVFLLRLGGLESHESAVDLALTGRGERGGRSGAPGPATLVQLRGQVPAGTPVVVDTISGGLVPIGHVPALRARDRAAVMHSWLFSPALAETDCQDVAGAKCRGGPAIPLSGRCPQALGKSP